LKLAISKQEQTELDVSVPLLGLTRDTGSAMFPLYDGERISSHGDAIVVVANYRLNAFGYLGSKELQVR
jgi:carboxylesterase type B